MKTPSQLACLAVCLVACLAIAAGPATGQSTRPASLPNGSFEDGDAAPTGWTLHGQGWYVKDGAAEGRRAVGVTGDGKASGAWQSQAVAFAPAAVYELRFQARSMDAAAGGTATSGPGFCNRDLGIPPAEWTAYRSRFRTGSAAAPAAASDAAIHLGQWEVKGAIAFDDVRLYPALPAYLQAWPVVLGAGETLRPSPAGDGGNGSGGCTYEALAPLGEEHGNFTRTLADQACQFNSNRWCFADGSRVVYRYDPGRSHTKAAVELTVCWYQGGELAAEASADGEHWTPLGSMTALGARKFDIPAALLPAKAVWVRLSGRPDFGEPSRAAAGKKGCALQVSRIAYTAAVDGPPVSLVGRTDYVVATHAEGKPQIDVEIIGLGDALPGGQNAMLAMFRPAPGAGEPVAFKASVSVTGPDGKTSDFTSQPSNHTATAAAAPMALSYDLSGPGDHTLRLGVETLAGKQTYEVGLHVAALYDASYGLSLPGGRSDDPAVTAALWWCSSGWKVSRTRPAPRAAGDAIVLRAARNQAQAAQLVIRPLRELKGLRVEATALAGPGGATIPPSAVEILRVRYVPVAQPTDATGVVGDWPDPLPPLAAPLDLPAGKNQPLWVRVRVPAAAAAGTYRGTIRLSAEGYQAQAPIRVEVYNFALPDRMTCVTAFGFEPAMAWRYHNVRDPAQRREVLDKYLACLADHHISPYDPAPMDPFVVTWPAAAGPWQGGTRDRDNPHAGKACLKVADTSTTASPAATYTQPIAIPAGPAGAVVGGLRLRLFHRAAVADHPFIVSLNHHDADGKWMPGRNRDIRVTGSTKWQVLDVTVKDFPPGAKSVRLTLWPCLYDEQGKTTGTVWYDDVSLTDAATAAELLAGGVEGFEPLTPDQLVPTFDFTAWDAAMERAMARYHFNSFSVPIQGLGGGTFESRTEPTLLGYAQDTPEYQAAFTNYCHALQEHLRQKGWLKDAFVYWFDEPEPKDYPFVMNGFRKLQAAAPDLGRMLTEQVEPALIGGPNIWCPVTPEYNPARAEPRRLLGERIWWYVCCGPKAPYCTLFIDHPATELRVWLWQTWQRHIEGVLVWSTNYWTSSNAYPDPAHPQNPYEDPMGWVSGYGTPAGGRAPWGNGDGRFLYPPESAADGHPKDPVLAAPVESIRLEMLREGIEDYEYLTILRRLLADRGPKLSQDKRTAALALLEVPPEITKDMTTFTKDPAPIESRRHAVAQAIEELARD
jgi:hypothetical protein